LLGAPRARLRLQWQAELGYHLVLRFLFEAQDAGPRYWSYRVIEGDSAALPGFVALPHDESR
jgi:hypothetical protein